MEVTSPHEARRIICFGDSLTLGIGTAELDKWATKLALGLEKWRPNAFSLYNRGFNGATTTVALDKIDSELGYLMPATVLVAFAANDSYVRDYRRTANVGVEEFKNNLVEIARYIIERGGQPILLAAHIPGPDRRAGPAYLPGNGCTYAENFRPYCEASPKSAIP